VAAAGDDVKTDSEVFADQLDGDWDGPTQAQVDAQVKAGAGSEARIMRDAQIDEWLRRHPGATCPRTTAGLLADLEATWTKGVAA